METMLFAACGRLFTAVGLIHRKKDYGQRKDDTA